MLSFPEKSLVLKLKPNAYKQFISVTGKNMALPKALPSINYQGSLLIENLFLQHVLLPAGMLKQSANNYC